MPIKRFIEVSFQKEGIHCYPEAATDPALAEVSFLAHPHRHIFHFKVRVSVTHNNRDIEFILLKRYIEETYSEPTLSINNKSCEMLAEELIDVLKLQLGIYREITVSVFEDAENGAVVEYTPGPEVLKWKALEPS